MKEECRENMEKIFAEAKNKFVSINETNFSSEKATIYLIDFLVETSINFLLLELYKHGEDISKDFNLNSWVVSKIMEGELKDFKLLRPYECLADYLKMFTEDFDEMSNEIVFLAASIKSSKLREKRSLKIENETKTTNKREIFFLS